MIYSGGNAWRWEEAEPKMEIEFVKNCQVTSANRKEEKEVENCPDIGFGTGPCTLSQTLVDHLEVKYEILC